MVRNMAVFIGAAVIGGVETFSFLVLLCRG